ncbi:hypothetical protein B0H14DRAFT_3152123 [Mycena olivaceomarginata]|nr:hypothetical protein B0H14DRAFT_3152123 [Mycena olivaceomarginata]
MIPPVDSVYYKPDPTRSGATFKLYAPTKIPDLPPMKILRVKDLLTAEKAAAKGWDPNKVLKSSWPSTLLNNNGQRAMSRPETVLARCYENDAPYDPQISMMTIALEMPLATGAREEGPAQVWRVNATGSSTPLVARMYDPLYFTTTIYDRFRIIERAVASEKEAYARLKDYQGTLVPRFHGIFVAEIPGARPRHVYVVLLEYIAGVDLQARMRTAGEATCLQHKAGLFNAVARASYPLYRNGVRPDDLMDRNVLLQEPQEPSAENFCAEPGCPFRNIFHIDLGDSPDDEHPYAPRVFIIDLEDVRFETWDYELSQCRKCMVRLWEVYAEWLAHQDIRPCFDVWG